MFTEIIKIIEGGLSGDKEKVASYATTLAGNLAKNGDLALSKKINAVLLNKKGTLTSLDSFSTRPVDSESRMEIVEISSPEIDSSKIVLSKFTHDEIDSFVACYKERERFLKMGLELPNSLLLYGPPGCGKTTVANYVSSVVGLPLVTARLDGLVSSLLGSTSKNIRKIFDYVSKRECVLFLDEFDVIAKLRDDKNELGELKRVVNSLIQNIDSMNSNNLLIAATNHHELLDPAIWRRFSKVISLEKPDRGDIERLLNIYIKDFGDFAQKLDKSVGQLSETLLGLSHSSIKTILNNAVRNALVNGKRIVNKCNVLREVYFYKNHSIGDEIDFIKFLLENKASYREINEIQGIPMRKIQSVAQEAHKEEPVNGYA